MPISPTRERRPLGQAAERRRSPWSVRAERALQLAVCGLAGAVMMALEIVGVRLFAPYFGYSVFVWGSLISVVMAALALGYALGGWIADRSATDRPIYLALLVSGLFQAESLATAHPLLRTLSEFGDFAGVSLATLGVLAPSMTALASVSPLVIRRLSASGHIGAAAGTVSALATAGSMAGILGASFYLVPGFGVLFTLELLCGLTLAPAAIGLARSLRPQALVLLAMLPLLRFAPLRPEVPGTLWTAETPYNWLRVAQLGRERVLFLNDDAAQTVRAAAGGGTGYYYDQFALGPLLVDAHRAVVLGMGAGESMMAARRTSPGLVFDAVEIDPGVVAAAQRWFGLDTSDPRLRIHIADARRWLTRTGRRYDLVQFDAYQGSPYIPFYLLTQEFFALLRAHMTADALLMMNLFDASGSRELLNRTAATLRTVFPALFVVSGPFGNRMIYAFCRPRRLRQLRPRLAAEKLPLARSVAREIARLDPPASARPFTDDLAPVEVITRRMLTAAR